MCFLFLSIVPPSGCPELHEVIRNVSGWHWYSTKGNECLWIYLLRPWRGLKNCLCPTLVVPLDDGQNSCHPRLRDSLWNNGGLQIGIFEPSFLSTLPFQLEHSFSRGDKQSTTILPGTQCPLGLHSSRTTFCPSTEWIPHYCPQTIQTFFILSSKNDLSHLTIMYRITQENIHFLKRWRKSRKCLGKHHKMKLEMMLTSR